MRRALQLAALTALLRPDALPPADLNWPRLLGLANAHLLGPSVFAALTAKRTLDLVPGDVRDYLAMLHALNRARNRVVRDQVEEAVGALNRRGVTPMLLKGSVTLFDDPFGDPGARMIGDIDLLVPADRLAEALAALRDIDYRDTSVYEAGHNAYGELARPGDAAALDLHVAPVDARHLLSACEMWEGAVALPTPGLSVCAALPTLRMLHCLLHAQIHHLGLYYRGELRLNQLYELVMMARHFGPAAGFTAIEARYRAHRLETALQSYLLTAERLLGLPWPLANAPGPLARLHHRRCLLQMGVPSLAWLAGPCGNLRGALAWHRMQALYGAQRGPLPRRLWHLGRFLRRRSLSDGVARVFRNS